MPENTEVTKRGGSAVIPCAFAFISSFCVMLVELVAGRMLSRHVGASLYTWTSIIGVVLGGITIGNLIGGRIADRFPPRKSLAVLLFLGGALCLAIPLLDHEVAVWSAWDRVNLGSWPVRVAMQVVLVFLAPATALGLIGPVVAKWALERGTQTGRTVGNVYAWGAFGSIMGTFVTGFFLVAALGAAGVTMAAGGVLILCSLILAPRTLSPVGAVAWPLIFGSVLAFFLSTQGRYKEWVWLQGRPVVQERRAPGRLYLDETQYSYIAVVEERGTGNLQLVLDNLVHAEYRPGRVTQMEYAYEKIYASITHRFGRDVTEPNVLFLGGGGYMFPRYLQELWPMSRLQVAEIDPGVTEACFTAFDLRPEQTRVLRRYDTEELRAALAPVNMKTAGGERARRPMAIYHLDARLHVEDILRARAAGQSVEPFDFIYGDAFNDYSVPFHLVTLEFAGKIRALLRPETGLYLLNVIDIYASGRFLGAIYNTLRREFKQVYIFSNTPNGPNPNPAGRDTFIVVGALRDLDLSDLGNRPGEMPFPGTLLKEEHLKVLEARSRGVILTDDYSPVENLLEEVVRRRAQR